MSAGGARGSLLVFAAIAIRRLVELELKTK
jgi:hypothetical protein